MGRKFLGLLHRFLSMLVLACVLSFSFTSAATVTDAYDQPTSLVISTAGNHKFVFVTPSGVSEGETITFTFDSLFDTSTIIEDDVDIADDGVDLTTFATCAGAEEASVAIAGDVITITICAGDGGAIAATSIVTVEIGTNASASGSGVNQIVNPTNAATYYVALGGTFGDAASFAYPFVTQNSGAVSGTILPTGGGGDSVGDGGDEGTPDVPDVVDDPTDPVIETPVDPVIPADTTDESDVSDEGDTADGGDAPISDNDDSPVDNQAPSDTGSSSAGDTGENDTDTETSSQGDVEPIAFDTLIVVDGGVTLSPDGDTFTAIAGTETTVVVDIEIDSVAQVRVIINDDVYELLPVDGQYSTNVTVPVADSSVTIEVEGNDGSIVEETYYLDVRNSGLVYEVLNDERVAVPGAIVTVYEVIGGSRVPWNAELYGSVNPVTVGNDGGISWYVPNGTYIVSVAKSGYEDASSGQISVRNHILAPVIELERVIVGEPELPINEEVSPSVAATTNSAAIVGAVTEAVSSAIESIREIPEVKVAIDIAAPTTVALATASVAVLASSFNLLPFLQYIFTSPILFFARRKRKAFGVVYNAATKLPVDLAIVRLFSVPDHKLVRSVVTDSQGKYLLVVSPGKYIVEVMKPNFSSPSVMMAGKKDDGQFLDVYTGQEIEVTADEATIAANIPLDPASTIEGITPRHVAHQRLLRSFQHTVAVVGIILAFAVLIISPSIFAGIMAMVQTGVYFLARRLSKGRKPKGWGIVYDSASRLPVGNAVVRLFEPTYNKLVETVLTDRFGRYAFLVGPSEYYVSYSKPGYTEKIVKPIDYRGKTEPSALALDVPIEETKGGV